MRRARRMLAMVAMASILMTACGGDGGGASGEELCEAEFGCVTIGAGEPIKIGTLLSISGATSFLGLDSQRAVKLAVDHLDGKLDGKDGQLLEHPVTMVNEDDGCSKAGGQSGATRLAADQQIVAVIGTSCSSSALGVADKIFSDKGIVIISPSNTNPNLTAEGTHQPYYFRTAHNDKIQGAVVADFAYNQLKARTAATIHDESPYADALAAVFRDNFEKLGGSIVNNGNQAVQSSDTDLRPVLQVIGQASPDFLYGPNFNPVCALTAKQARAVRGLNDTAIAGSDGCLETAYLNTGGRDVSGTYLTGPDFSGVQETNKFLQDEFIPAYRRQFGQAPTASFHSHAWDATKVLFAAIEKVAIKNDDGSLQIPRKALRDEVAKSKGYAGLSGTIECTELGDCATAVTIAVYRAPELPVEGGNPNAKPVFTSTKTLADVS